MITIITDKGRWLSVEAARVHIDGWPDQEFYVHNAVIDGTVRGDLWTVTVAGHSVTDAEYTTIDAAIQAAQRAMNGRTRAQSERMLHRALQVHRVQLGE